MAAELGVKNVITYPLKTFDINYDSQKILLGLLKKINV